MNDSEKDMMIAQIEKMSFFYGNTSVLDHIEFRLNFGDYMILTGENGCGKSTFLKLLLGELRPQQGKVRLFNQSVGPAVFRRFHIGYVPQNSISKNQNFPATVEEIMRTGLSWNLHGKETRDNPKKKFILHCLNLKCRIIFSDRLERFPADSSRESCLHVHWSACRSC